MEINFLVHASARMDFFSRIKVFHHSSQIVFFPTTKHPKVTKLAFDHAQVLEWVLCNNCNCFLVSFSISGQFWLSEDTGMPVLWSCGTGFQVINFRLFYLENKWWKTKVDENVAPNCLFWLTWTRNSTSIGLTYELQVITYKHVVM